MVATAHSISMAQERRRQRQWDVFLREAERERESRIEEIVVRVCEGCETSTFVWYGEELDTCWVCRRYSGVVCPAPPRWQARVPGKYSDPVPRYVPLPTRPFRFRAERVPERWSRERGEYEREYWKLVEPLGPVPAPVPSALAEPGPARGRAKKRRKRPACSAAAW